MVASEKTAYSKVRNPAQSGVIRAQCEVKKKMKVSGAQVKAARDLLKITQPELARATGIGERTIQKFEADEAIPKPANLAKILGELERRGIEFTNGTGIGVRLNFEKAAAFARAGSHTRKEADH